MIRRLLALALLAASGPALAQTCTTSWAAPADGDWSTATNWTSGVPEPGDVACITASSRYTVALGGFVGADVATLDSGTFERITVTSAMSACDLYTLSASGVTTAFDGFAANNQDAVTAGVVGVGVGVEEDDSGLPREVTLSTVRPNPARGAATLRWGLPDAGRADVRVYDLLGREVAVLASGEAAPTGWHETRWSADVASGVYVVRFEAQIGGQTTARTRRMVVLR